MSDGEQTVKIRFEGVTLDEAGMRADELRSELQDIAGVSVEKDKDDATNMDFGATLVLVLGTPAVLYLAKGIANYLSRTGTSLLIEKDKKLVATGIKGEDVARIVEALSKSDKPSG